MKIFLIPALSLFTTLVFAQNPNPSIAVDDAISVEMQAENLPGLSTVIVKDGQIVWKKSYGFAHKPNGTLVHDSSVFLMASVSKLFTGTAMLQMVDEGLIQLDDPINNYLSFNIEIPGHSGTPITFRHLMTHSSSIKDANVMDDYYSTGDPTISLSDVIQRYLVIGGQDYNASNNFHNAAPGTNYDYSNMGSALMGYMVEVITNQSFDDYCRVNIFDPMCMDLTDWHLDYFDTLQVVQPHEYAGGSYSTVAHYGFGDYPNGQLRSNVWDIANFMQMVIDDGMFQGEQILSSSIINQMLTAQVPSLDNTQGLSWYTEEIYNDNTPVALWGHNGGETGVSTDLYIDKQNNIGIAVMANGGGDCLGICDELYTYAMGLSNGIGLKSCLTMVSEQEQNKFIVFPNPSFGQIRIEVQEKGELSVFSGGQLVKAFDLATGRKEVDLSDLAPGLYSVSFNSEGSMSYAKIVIQ